MISRYAYHGLTWVDLESPSREEMLHITEEFGLSKLAEDELFTEHAPATITLYDQYLSLTLLCPAANDSGTAVSNHKLTAIVGKKFLITARQHPIAGLYGFASQFEQVEKIEQSKKIVDGNTLFTELLKHVYEVGHKDLANISHRIATLEHSLFTANEQRMSRAIFNAKRSVLSFKEGIAAHEGLLKAYTAATTLLFPNDIGHTISVTSEHAALCSSIDSKYEILSAMQKTNTAMIASKTSDRIKTLIIIGSLILAATVILHFI